jgi:hypothetical protein
VTRADWRRRLQLTALALVACDLLLLWLAIAIQHETFQDLVWIPFFFVALPLVGAALAARWPRLGATWLLVPFFWQLLVVVTSLTQFADGPVIVALLLLGAAISAYGLYCVVRVFRTRPAD